MRVLALFDIDGTLLRTEGEAVQAMIDVGVRFFGDAFTFDGVPVAAPYTIPKYTHASPTQAQTQHIHTQAIYSPNAINSSSSTVDFQ